jgi:tRNA pseudouridine55 synthase
VARKKSDNDRICGLLVINKPAGITSHDVVQHVRRWAGQRRVGHLGTLDPLATGVLPLALGEATKLSQLLTHGAKGYRGTIRLGAETTTYDREGEITASSDGPWPPRETVEKCLDQFRGEILQVPPPYSAVKLGGEAAYRRARRGEQVELEPRPVQFYRLEIVAYEPPDLEVEVECSAGTYLRSLAHDLGLELGTFAHLSDLCRTRSGPFTLEQAVTPEQLEELDESRVIPMAAATGLPSYEVDARTARRVSLGTQLGRHEVRGAPAEGTLQLVHKGRLVALLEASRGLPQLRTLRVFLEGTKS